MIFFYTKIENIHQQISFQNNVASDLLYLSPHDSLLSLIYSFELPTIDEISGLIKQSKSSTCQLDPLPTQSLFIFSIWYSNWYYTLVSHLWCGIFIF